MNQIKRIKKTKTLKINLIQFIKQNLIHLSKLNRAKSQRKKRL